MTIKRRPLGGGQRQNNNNGGGNSGNGSKPGNGGNTSAQRPNAGRSTQPNPGGNAPVQRGQNPGRNPGPGQQRPLESGARRNRRGGGRGRRGRRRSTQQRRPITPPSVMHRDLLLIVSPQTATSIETVRAKYDPLAKKVAAHITILPPEAESFVGKDFLKGVKPEVLSECRELVFNSVEIQDHMYLRLLPDRESMEKLRFLRQKLLAQVTEEAAAAPIGPQTAVSADGEDDDLDEEDLLEAEGGGVLSAENSDQLTDEDVDAALEDMPPEDLLPVAAPKKEDPDHFYITLGYAPRSGVEAAVLFAKTTLNLPLTLNFEKLLLEEFAENQVSMPVDSLPLK